MTTLVDISRDQTKELLLYPLKQYSLAICSDFCKDAYKRISYLLVSDRQWQYKSFDLSDKQFQYEKKNCRKYFKCMFFRIFHMK